MNIRRFKKILAMYLLFFLLICVIVPFNVYFEGSIGVKENEYINYGLTYSFIGQAGYEDIDSAILIPNNGSSYTAKAKGVMNYRLNMPILAIELLSLTVVFFGAAYISCKKE